MPANDEVAVKLDSILITDELARRPRRAADYKAENDSLRALAQHLVDSPETLLQRLVDMALQLCRCGSAGISIPELNADGEPVFRWVAAAGIYARYEGHTIPGDLSPSSLCLERGSPQLFSHPARFFSFFSGLEPDIVEGLVIELRGHGEPVGTLWIAQHDTERAFDLEDVRLMTSLASFTAAALQAQRQRAEVRRANELKDRFLATLSHELRTLLTAILGWTRMMRQGVIAPDRVPHALETIERNAQLQMDLVSDLLDLERIRMGTLRLKPENVALDALFTGILDSFAPAAQAKSLTIDAHVQPDIDPVWADQLRLEQVMRNLISNAVKFTPDGGRIDVTLGQTGSMAEIVVADTGIGIKPESLPHVFDAFTQADTDHRTISQGLGLGLAIVRHLVALHGGTVTAVSDGPGQGTRFTVTLPTTRARARAAGASS
jgi:signal transduction histidine kinase